MRNSVNDGFITEFANLIEAKKGELSYGIYFPQLECKKRTEVEHWVEEVFDNFYKEERKRKKQKKKKEKRIHAYWEYCPDVNDTGLGGWCCSNCGAENDALGTCVNVAIPLVNYEKLRYCPKCGAKMKL